MLNPKNIIMANKKKIDLWRSMLTKTMEIVNERNYGGKTNKEEEFYD